jgi:hypothetical protein
VQGWRYQLALFSNLVADRVNAGAADLVDAWFDAWADPDADRRQQTLSRIAAPDLRFRDRFGCTDGIADLLPTSPPRSTSCPAFGCRARRAAPLSGHRARRLDGARRGRSGSRTRHERVPAGPDGRIESVTGFWNAPS